MSVLLREQRCVFQSGTEEQLMHVEEFICGTEQWPDRCRVDVPATHMRAAQRFYGPTSDAAAKRAAEYVSEGRLASIKSCNLIRIGPDSK
jgi:hypothetical protein